MNAYTPPKIDKVLISLVWEPPDNGWFKLNVDGSRRFGAGTIGAGSVIRDSRGGWLGGFTVNLGIGQILDAECWGLFFGIRLAIDKRVSKLIIEMDSASVVQLIQMTDALHSHPLAGVISNCREVMNRFDCCVLRHIYRETNGVADCLAKWSYNVDLGLYTFEIQVPTWVGSFLMDDMLRVPRTRAICSNFA
ncbi:hypothetical protein CerSpe_198850 [Prunus speciosa]